MGAQPPAFFFILNLKQVLNLVFLPAFASWGEEQQGWATTIRIKKNF